MRACMRVCFVLRFYIDVGHIFIRILDTVKEIDTNQKYAVCGICVCVSRCTRDKIRMDVIWKKGWFLCIDNNISYDKDERYMSLQSKLMLFCQSKKVAFVS